MDVRPIDNRTRSSQSGWVDNLTDITTWIARVAVYITQRSRECPLVLFVAWGVPVCVRIKQGCAQQLHKNNTGKNPTAYLPILHFWVQVPVPSPWERKGGSERVLLQHPEIEGAVGRLYQTERGGQSLLFRSQQRRQCGTTFMQPQSSLSASSVD